MCNRIQCPVFVIKLGRHEGLVYNKDKYKNMKQTFCMGFEWKQTKTYLTRVYKTNIHKRTDTPPI